jgi:cytochrome c-type biogenesis protein CcmH
MFLLFGVMTLAALFAVTRPLLRSAQAQTVGGSDLAVYRDQLEEIDRDRAAGLIGETEAAAARVEISRRLLAAADAPNAVANSSATTVRWRGRAAAAMTVILVPCLAAGLYLWLGSPELASEELRDGNHGAVVAKEVADLIAQTEQYLERNPQDGRAWEVLAPVYMQMGRYPDSANAWRKAIALLGENAERDANLGEALTAQADGAVTDDAKASFVRALALDRTNVSARYYSGLAAEQGGERDKAAEIWRDLIADAPPGTPWADVVRQSLARLDGSTTAEMPAQQSAMIRAMVDGLAARLKQNGLDADGWVRLVRSYRVLGQTGDAVAAIADARAALAGDAAKLQQFNAALEDMNATGAAPPQAQQTASAESHEGANVEDMVRRLAERLKASGSDPAGWLMLVRSYATLGEKDKAKEAIADGRQALAGDADKLNQFNTALRSFNLGD